MPVDEHLNLAVCPACSTPVWRWKAGGIEYTADPTALNAQEAVTAHLGGRRLYRLTLVGGHRNIRPAWNTELTALSGAEPPTILGGHPCKAVTRPYAAPQPTGGTGAPGKAPSPPAGRTAASSAPSAPTPPPSGAPAAAKPRSEGRTGGPRCDACGHPCADGTYASVEVGDLVVWATHVQEGTCTPA